MTATATIDGRRIAVREDDTILSAARRAGIAIPTLCHVQGLAAEGGCRLCLVEVEGAGRPQAACHTPLEPGTEVRTHTPALSALRRNVLQLVVDAHPDAGFTANPDGTPLERLMAELGVEGGAARAAAPLAVDASHPYLRFERARCASPAVAACWPAPRSRARTCTRWRTAAPSRGWCSAAATRSPRAPA